MPAIQQDNHRSNAQLQANKRASVAPPVYQPIARSPVQRMQAPAVYRPNANVPVQRVSAPTGYLPSAQTAVRRVLPPPVYRPNPDQPAQLKAQKACAPPIYGPRVSRYGVTQPRMSSSGSVLQRANQSGVYTTAETGKAQAAYDQAVDELGGAIAHGFGTSMSAQSAKFTNQEKALQERKHEILDEQKLAKDRLQREEHQQEKKEKEVARAQKAREKRVGVLRQMAHYVKTHLGQFTDEFSLLGNEERYYRDVLDEFVTTGDKKAKFTEEDVKDNFDAVIAQVKKDVVY